MRTARVVAVLLLALLACEREQRHFGSAGATRGPVGAVRMSPLQPGVPTTDTRWTIYQDNRWAVGEGQRLYSWFNCAGCHATGGGGGIGPPLRDDTWIYGSDPENIFRTILEGRPNGMPAFEGRINADDTWKLVAYVRTLAGLTPRDLWPARADQSDDTNPRPSR